MQGKDGQDFGGNPADEGGELDEVIAEEEHFQVRSSSIMAEELQIQEVAPSATNKNTRRPTLSALYANFELARVIKSLDCYTNISA
ncbi:hypothetical protein IGA99_33770, partial [Pseudomonas aeruginosa]|uniref:hypothetical protein n=1 Tax=Pseudomonas aeruginosa TaxID=287 RepID=UPI0022374586